MEIAMARQLLNTRHRAQSDTAVTGSLARFVRPIAMGAFSAAVAGLTNLAFTDRAAAQTWNSGAAMFWNDPTSWTPNAVPNAVDATVTFNAIIPGTGSAVSLLGGPFTVGTLNLNSAIANSYHYLQQGTLIMEVSAGSAAINVQTSSFAADFAATLQLNSNTVITTASAAANLSFVGAVTGVGALTVAGPGTVTFWGANNYTGATTVNGGSLIVEGSNASSILTTVNASGRLSGMGSVGVTQINAGGSLAPGAIGSTGTFLTLASLAMQSGAQYFVSVDPTTSTFANVTGNASLGGATVGASFAAGSYVAKQYTILNAGSITGTFDPTVVNAGLPSGFQTSLSYDATHAYLNLALSFAPPSGNLNANQQNVGNALINFFNSNGTIPIVFGGLRPADLTQLSGEIGSAPQQTTFNAMNQFMGVMTDTFIAGRGDPISAGVGPNAYADEAASAYARKRNPNEALAAIYTKAPIVAPSFERSWSVWATGFGGSQQTDGSMIAGSNDTNSSLFAMAVGADYRISRDTLVGFALAGGGTKFTVANAFGGGKSDLFQAGAFFRHAVGAAYISGALAYGWQDVTTDRTVTVSGLDRLRAEFNANSYSGRLEGGYRLVSHGVGLTPYGAAQFTTFDAPAYLEQVIAGSDQFALNYNAKTITDTRTELGLRSDKSFALQTAILTLRGRLAWAHDYNSDRGIGATFQTLPGASFFVNGAAQASDSALVTASAEAKWMSGWSTAATFEGEFSSVTRSYAGKGVVRYAW
jgi:autotransporter-associated beta strand protein